MQAITHFLVGIILEALIFPPIPPFGIVIGPLEIIIGILACFFSHFLIDIIAKMTYHPASAQTDDKFWIVYHILIYIASGFVLVYFWNPYWLGMGISVIVDLYDWGFIRGVSYLKKDPDWFRKYRIHPIIDKIRDRLFFWLPNWNEKYYGVIPEILLVGFLFYLIFCLQ